MIDLLASSTKIIGRIASHLLAIANTPKLMSAWTTLVQCEETLRRLAQLNGSFQNEPSDATSAE